MTEGAVRGREGEVEGGRGDEGQNEVEGVDERLELSSCFQTKMDPMPPMRLALELLRQIPV